MTYEDIRYAPYLRQLWSLLKNVKYLKFKSLARRFYDRQYARDIDHQWKVTGYYGKLASFHTHLPLVELFSSHDINYHDWVLKLKAKLQRYQPLAPIKVIWDPFYSRWMVVDGNHRLAAYRSEKSGSFDVPVIILYPVGRLDTYGPIRKDLAYAQKDAKEWHEKNIASRSQGN